MNISRITHRIWKETNMQPSRVRSSNLISCCLLSLHFLCDILLTFTVLVDNEIGCTKRPWMKATFGGKFDLGPQVKRMRPGEKCFSFGTRYVD